MQNTAKRELIKQVMNNVIYQVEVNSSSCNYELWLNGMRIDIQKMDMPIRYDLPINQWVKNGVNNFKIIILPISKQKELAKKAYLQLTIFKNSTVSKLSGSREEIKKIQTPSFDNNENSTPITFEEYVLKESLDLAFAFPNANFNELVITELSKKELIDLYDLFVNAFNKKDMKTILELMDYKIVQFSSAYQTSYLVEVERQKKMMNYLFTKKMEYVNFQEYSISVFDGGKIFCLEDEFGEQPIQFQDDDGDIISYPFYFGKRKGHNVGVVL